MPALRPERPAARPRVMAPVSGDYVQQQLASAAQRTADQLRDRSSLVQTLVVGDNVINHGLGRVPIGATVSPTVASAAWAWAMTKADSSQATITCVGIDQPNAALEFFA